MYPSEGLMATLNEIRETSIDNNTLYHKQVPIVDITTSIQAFGTPILGDAQTFNEFVSALVNRIAFTSFSNRYTFDNPLQVLYGDEIPLGSVVQDIYVNPAQARKYDINDFAGILTMYESDTKVQYLPKNLDVQYPVSVTRTELRKAFSSWGNLEQFINELVNSLYNGLYMDEYELVKNLVADAYTRNVGVIDVVTLPTDEATSKAFVKKLRSYFLKFQKPNTNFNAWGKVGGYGRPVKTYTRAEDIYVLITDDIYTEVSVETLASAFNLDKADLMGRVISVDSFGNDKIGAIICDRRWFKINPQELFLEEIYNPSNRIRNFFLNRIASFNMSLFANGVILASEEPDVTITTATFEHSTATMKVGEVLNETLNTEPFTGNSEITYEVDDETLIGLEKINNKTIAIKGKKAGTATITATSGSVTAQMVVTITD